MALIDSKINSIKEIMELNLTIPEYQRAYKWSTQTVTTLFYDMKNAMDNNKDEYRLGSLIAYCKDNTTYEIVDGQQRITTLCIILYHLNASNKIKDFTFNFNSIPALQENNKTIKWLIKSLGDDIEYQKRFKDYLLNKCSLAMLVTNNEREAFQFFDSQNQKGMKLFPHDLLKAYHLREFQENLDDDDLGVIKSWEDENKKNIVDVFNYQLYPIVCWTQNKNGLEYDETKIDTFKGISKNDTYNYFLYHDKANKDSYVCQLNQPIMAGRGFFEYVKHYLELKANIEERISVQFKSKEKIKAIYCPTNGAGNRYLKELYICVLMAFTDRFSLEVLDENIMHKLYSWCYSLRFDKDLVTKKGINKYALGKQGLNYGINMFEIISNMKNPTEIFHIVLDDVKEKSGYQDMHVYIIEGKINEQK